MKKEIILFLVLAILGIQKSQAQDVPIDTLAYVYDLLPGESAKSLSDAYGELEPSVLNDIQWLNNTPLGKDTEMRNDKSRFVLMWMNGSPKVSIRLDDRVVTFQDAEPVILMSYMMGWTEYSLRNNYSNDNIYATVAGINNAVEFYSKNRKLLRKNKELEKYKQMIKNNTLTRYVADIVTQ